MKNIIHTDKAPKAIGPYSQGILKNNMLFVSGQIPLAPESMQIVSDDIREQTKQVLANLQAVITEAGFTMEDIVKTTIYLTSMTDFALVNEVYSGVFSHNPPARATVAVSGLPKNVRIEIDAIAYTN